MKAKRVPSLAPSPFSRAPARELLYAALLLALGLTLLITFAGATFLPVRDFWLDEICTYLLVTDPSLTHAMDALRHGVDSNPPALYLILRALHFVGIPITEITLRLFAVASLGAGLLGCYATLRHFVDRLTCAVAITFLLAGSLLLGNMFEARFYDPWFAICAWVCYTLLIRRTAPRLASGIALALLTILMLTIHYFGLFSFLLIVPADFLADPRPLATRFKVRWPLLAALPALALVLYFYAHQKKAFTVPSWVDPPDLQRSLWFLGLTMYARLFAALAGLLLAAWFLRRKLPLWRTDPMPPLRPLASILSLLILPAFVLLFSLIMQPATVPRYALPAMAGVFAFAALGISRLRPPLAIALALACLVTSGYQLHEMSAQFEAASTVPALYAKILESAPADEIVVCERRHDLYPMVLYYPQYKSRCYLLDFETGQEPDAVLTPTPAYCIVERDAHRAVSTFYPDFQLIRKTDLPKNKPFIVIADDHDDEKFRLARLEKRFASATVKPIAGRMFEVTPVIAP